MENGVVGKTINVGGLIQRTRSIVGGGIMLTGSATEFAAIGGIALGVSVFAGAAAAIALSTGASEFFTESWNNGSNEFMTSLTQTCVQAMEVGGVSIVLSALGYSVGAGIQAIGGFIADKTHNLLPTNSRKIHAVLKDSIDSLKDGVKTTDTVSSRIEKIRQQNFESTSLQSLKK